MNQQNTITEWIERFIRNSSDFMLWKNNDSSFRYGNQTTVRLLGYKNIDNLVGSTDYNIPLESVASHANIFRDQDRKAMQNGTLETLEILRYTDGFKVVLSKKTALKDLDDKIFGLLFCGTILPNNILNSIGNLLLLNNQAPRHPSRMKLHYNLTAEIEIPNKKFPRRTDECLFYMLRGKSAKEIAKHMCLSIRTVEKYFDLLKLHFECQKKTELIEKAIAEGYINFIPKRLFQKTMKMFMTMK